MIHRVTEHVDDEGRVIQELRPMDGPNLAVTQYVGRAMMVVQGPQGQTGMPISFKIAAKSITDAYAGFADALKKHIKELRKQAPKIVLPGMNR